MSTVRWEPGDDMLTNGKSIFTGTLFVLVTLCFGLRYCCEAQDFGPNPPPNALTSTTIWSGPNNQFVDCSLEDATGWWWGTDNDGIWHYSPQAKPGLCWQHFRAEDGLYDDSITALCLDRKGRLWAGTERRGVCVYNNSGWRNYDLMTGPLGAHVTSIAMNPVNGDIWISSEAGLAIYSDTSNRWSYLTSADGLTTNAINCIAFTASGEAIVGASDAGILLGFPATNYHKWTHIVAAPVAELSEVGSGLSSNQINCLLVNKAGKIYCGTSSGLSFSIDAGNTWSFIHGWKWQLKIRRAAISSGAVNSNSAALPLSDDYITALAYDKNGLLYIGHRFGGLEVLYDAPGAQVYHTNLNEYGTYIRALTLLSSNGLLIGNYAGGISAISWTTAKSVPETNPTKLHAPTLFPADASPWTAFSLNFVGKRLASIDPQSGTAPTAYFDGEDWQTQGNWLGRYGQEYAVLCAADGNQDYTMGDKSSFSVIPTIGLALNGVDTPSHWLQWEQSGDPRVLFDPEVMNRRESEWDDQGEQDEILTEGPDIWLTVTVPPGMHRLSLYFMNKDGHTRTTRYRDYLLQLWSATTGVDFHECYDNPAALPLDAETRVENFWPGVYERFVLTGPGTYYVKIDRNYSLNTSIQGVFIDPLGSVQPPAGQNGGTNASLSSFKDALVARAMDKTVTPSSPKTIEAAKSAWAQLDSLYSASACSGLQEPYRVQILRAAAAAGAPPSLLADWRVKLGIWTGDDWSQFGSALGRFTVQSSVAPK